MTKKKNPSEKEFQKFLSVVSKLEPIEFMGLIRIFNVDIFLKDEQKTPKTFEQIFSEVMDSYISASPLQRKNVMKILNAAASKKER